jgi:hypothetical protein
MDPITLAAIGSILQTGVGLQSDKRNRDRQNEANNRATREAAQHYNQTRADAQADWERNNKYNSPEEQMNRLRQAGLNPNLIYGKGADNTAQAIRSGQSGSNKVTPSTSKAADILNSGLQNYQQIRLQKAQTDNLAQQAAVMKQEELLKQTQVAKTIAETASTKFQLQQAKELKDAAIERANLENLQITANIPNTEANTQATITNTDIALQRNEREKIATSLNAEQTASNILQQKIQNAKTTLEMAKTEVEIRAANEQIKVIQQTYKNLILDGKLKAYELKLTKLGLTPKDSQWQKKISEFIDMSFNKASVKNTSRPGSLGEARGPKKKR